MDYMKYLKWALLAGIFAIPFIPFLVTTSMFFPFITGKNFVFRFVIELLAGILVLLALRDPAYRPKFSWVSMAVLSLFGAAVLGMLFGVDAGKSFWSNFERMEGVLGLFHLVLWFFITGVALSTEKLWTRFLQVSIGASAIMGIYVLFQLGGTFAINQGGVRTDGTFGNAIYLAVYMLFHIFFTLLLMVRHQGSKWIHALYGVALILQLVSLYYAATRSATLGLLGGLLVAALGVAVFEKENKKLRRGAVGVIGAVALVVVVFFSVRNMESVRNNPVLGRFASISSQETTVKSRFLIWNMALQGMAERPIFGWGQENFNFVFNKYYNPQMYAQEQWFDRAHNAYLDWGVSAGVVGLGAFLLLFLLAALAFMRASNLSVAERSILVGLLCAYAFHSFFVFDNLMSSVYFFLLLTLAHGFTKRDLPRAMFLTKPVQGGAFTAATLATIGIMGVGMYFINIPPIATAQTLIDGLTPTKSGVDAAGNSIQEQKNPLENLASFTAATESSSLGRQEVVEQLLQLASSAASNQNLDPQVRSGFINLATTKGAELLASRPGDARLELFYGSFLSQADKMTEGRTHLLAAHELSPNKQTILFELGINSYLRAGDIGNALATLKQAYELAPAYGEAQLYYAMALIYGGRLAESDMLLTKHFGTVMVDDNRIISAYSDAKLFDRVLAIWQIRATKSPSDPQTRVSLAVAYKDAGNTGKATEVLRQAVKDFPQYASQLADVAKQLGLSL